MSTDLDAMTIRKEVLSDERRYDKIHVTIARYVPVKSVIQ
jgi:hypothetical protein